MTIGFGSGGWGSSAWGSPVSAAPKLVGVVAIGENTLQLQFTSPIYFSGLLDQKDASNRKRFLITAIPETYGMDGTEAKAIGCSRVTVANYPGLLSGQVLNLTTDRPMTPSPAQYTVECNGLFSTDGVTPVDPSALSMQFTSVHKQLQPPQIETISPRGDFAVPQSQDATGTGTLGDPSKIVLGSFAIANGDYATVSGMAEYKERLYRRITSALDSFLHLAGKNFGGDLIQQVKKLGSAQNKSAILANVERQVAAEPETMAVAAKIVPSEANPGLLYLVVLAKTKFGKPIKLLTPINIST